jgi:hypothetical protein
MIPFFVASTSRATRIGSDGRAFAILFGQIALLSLSLTISASAAEPEIVRLRVPAKDVSRWFPAGTELRVLPAEQFNSLVRAARQGASRQQAARPPRLIHARHHARWNGSVLSGRTELVIEAASAGAADFILDPWTPAILATAETSKVLGARDSGKPSLWIDQAPNQRAVLEWEVQPRPGSHARVFNLAVPGEETTTLALEIPKSWMPSVDRGRRRGPLESADSGRNLWEIEAESGRIEVQVDKSDGGVSPVALNPWVSGSTKIDLRRATDRSGGLVNWTADWLVELDPRNPKPLEIELDPGLELIDVQGNVVRGYRSERVGNSTRLVVTLGGDLKSSTELRVLAHARIPSEGTWAIPALHPRNATWTGGRTTVTLDESHVLQECREKAGRRILGQPADSGALKQVVFDSESPRSPAELVFRKPRAESSCSVLGRLFVTGSPCRLECQLNWSLRSASMSDLDVDLSPAWLPDRVSIRNLEDPIAWHASVLPSGITRLHVSLPPTVLSEDELVLVIGASSTVPPGRGPLELPRVRPAGSRLGDEAWLAWVDKSTMIQPTAAVGLAWIDPEEVAGLLSPRGVESDLHEALAWRWIADDARARVDRVRIEQEPSASVRSSAHVDPTGRRLAIDGRLLVKAGALSLNSIPIWISQPDALLGSWSFHDEAGAIKLAPPPIDAAARERLGFPTGGAARRLLTKVASQTEKAIDFHAELPWSSPGSIPLVAVPEDYLFRGMIVVESPPGMRARVKSVALRRLNPAGERPSLEPDQDIAAGTRDDRFPEKKTIVHALGYDAPGGQLELVTEKLAPLSAAGVIREALLTTVVDPKGTTLNRLCLLVHSGEARSLDVVPRPDMSLVRIRRDGSDVIPIESRSALSIPLAGSNQLQRSSTIVIDYVVKGRQLADGDRLRPQLPEVSLPCLSFDWEVVTPRDWKAGDCGSGWIASDRENFEEWPCAALGVWKPAWDFRRSPRGDDADWLRFLDDRLAESIATELTFAEWFSRWDSGSWPVVIDRVSLNSAGLGPRSPCVLSRVNAERGNVSLATLEQHGLAIVRFPGALIITTRSDVPRFEPRDRWEAAIVESLLWGSDRTDRFQTLPRWRVEAFPKTISNAGDAAKGVRLSQGWSTWRFGAPAWPGTESFVYLIDVRARIISGWIIAALCLLAWFSCRRRLVSRRFLLLAGVMAGSLVINWVLPSRFASYSAAAFIAAFVALMLELGQRVAQLTATGRTAARSGSSLARRIAGTAVGLALFGFLQGGLASGQPPIDLFDESPILALFPYEGSFDPTRPPRDVILRLADFTRLSRWASAGVSPTFRSVRAVSALHRVLRRSAAEIVVDSEFELVAVGQAPFRWRVPVRSARDIEATLDGQQVPIAIEPDGESGTLAISRAGKHRLLIHRSAAARTEAGFETLSLPVNALPSAHLVVDPPPFDQQRAHESSTGASRLQAGQSLSARLGPADRIDIRWPRPGPAAVPRAAGIVEGLVLWDIDPAGDRIRGRFTFHQAQESSTIRFAHQPGLILRSARAAASVQTAWEEDSRKDEWTLHASGPLPAGSTIELDCWMPGDAPRAESGTPRAAAGDSGSSLRQLPRLQPIGVERYSGSVGVRRPGDWTGRLDPIVDTDPISDESFVKAWGSLPDDPLTLCGTSRFVRELRASLATGPAPARILVKPDVQLRLESGRIGMTLRAELTEQSGQLRDLEAELPSHIRLVDVTADGLADWTITPDNRLRLLFDRRLPGPTRVLRILAWIPLAEDPLKIGPRRHRVRVPWIEWAGAESSAGQLTVSSASKAELQGSAGLTAIPSESPPTAGATAPRFRQVFRVDDPGKLGEIVWESVPARVSVSIESQMTIHPDSAEWVAVLRYDVVGGALDLIHLKMPAAWASSAVLHLTGNKYQLTTETREKSAFWTITPERPIWGSQRFVLRSSRLLGADRELAHPEISPLGRGEVDAYLGNVNATGRPLPAENSVGLEKLPFAARFQAREFARGPGIPTAAFRVTREVWSLRVPLPRGFSPANDSRDVSARVALADVIVTAMPDRSAIGRAVYETVPESGSSLSVTFPGNCSLLWATVDGNPVTSFRSSSGAWSISLDERRQARVALIWRSEADATASSSGPPWPVALPRAGLGPAPTLVAVYTPPQLMIQGDSGGLEPTAMARIEMARADWLAGSISDLVAKIDRSSGRDHEKLVSLLVNHEMALRSAARSDRRGVPEAAVPRIGRSGPSAEKIRAARAATVDATRRAGLGADLASVQWYLGESPEDFAGPLVRVPAAIASDRIRLLGQPFAFFGVIPGIDEPSAKTSLTLENRPWLARASIPPIRAMVTLGLLFGFVLVTSGARAGIWINRSALILASGIAYALGGPLITAGALALAAIGWSAARG